MDKSYSNYEVTFAGHPTLLICASSPTRAIEHAMKCINNSLARIYARQPSVTIHDFECMVWP